MSDNNTNDDQQTPISISDVSETDTQPSDTTRDISPASHDSSSASGHAPDLEADDDVDELGAEAGIEYNEDEELGIDHKLQVNTQPEPPSEDSPS